MLFTIVPEPELSPEAEKPAGYGKKNDDKHGGDTNTEDDQANAYEQTSYNLVGNAEEDD
ncbi:hypothetical protein AB0J63_40560 [Streptosporangium canum]|uniref:hypothetical protein n=1 Tax=Streptosporangium canum TaxID=324952 RepID=UPI00341A2108